jgi:hypothetical protein
LQKIGSFASFLLPVALVASGLIYLTGNLREAFGPMSYSTADLLAGPVLGASFVTTILALRERIGTKASGRMDLALMIAVLAVGFMVAVALIRSANRGYHINHPELQLESSMSVMVAWTTLVAGLTSTGWHFIGWALLLTGWAGWSSERLPRLLSGLYLAAGVVSLFVFWLPDAEGTAGFLLIVLSVWTGILLLSASPGESKRR